MQTDSLPVAFWALAAIAITAYVGLALLRRNVSLRFVRLGCLAAIFLAVRVVLLVGAGLRAWEGMPMGLLLAGAIAGVAARRLWLVHTGEEELKERLEQACRGLRLECQWRDSTCLELVQREVDLQLRIVRLLPAVLGMRLPEATARSKSALLVRWLGKQYPGPIPPIPIHLSRED